MLEERRGEEKKGGEGMRGGDGGLGLGSLWVAG